MGLILTCVSIYVFGGDLAVRWGERRLRRFMLEIVLAAGAVSAVVAIVSPYAWHMFRNGGWAVGDALVIAWARQFPRQSLMLYGILRVNGRDLIAVTIGATVLFAIYFGPFVMAPELVACAAAALYPVAMLRR